jgi:hypothetical protein
MTEEQQEQQQQPQQQPSQEELRRQLEEQLRRVKVQDVIVESAVSVLNLAARRIAKEDERDLEQGRLGIEAVRALLDYLPEDARAQVRQALSELQVLYARQAGEGEQAAAEPGEAPPAAEGPQPDTPPSSDRLWTPPGSTG